MSATTYRCPCCGQVIFSYDASTGRITVRCHKGADTHLDTRFSLNVATPSVTPAPKTMPPTPAGPRKA